MKQTKDPGSIWGQDTLSPILVVQKLSERVSCPQFRRGKWVNFQN